MKDNHIARVSNFINRAVTLEKKINRFYIFWVINKRITRKKVFLTYFILTLPLLFPYESHGLWFLLCLQDEITTVIINPNATKANALFILQVFKFSYADARTHNAQPWKNYTLEHKSY